MGGEPPEGEEEQPDEGDQIDYNQEPLISYALFPENSDPFGPPTERSEPVRLDAILSSENPPRRSSADAGTLNFISPDDKKFVKVWSYVDSGAARSVCPVTHALRWR